MSLSDFFAKLKLSPKDAEVIFDRDEPIGRPTDLVMPRRRWFRGTPDSKLGSRAFPDQPRVGSSG